jgi:hypothetical protein
MLSELVALQMLELNRVKELGLQNWKLSWSGREQRTRITSGNARKAGSCPTE